ncbi:MAG TPA: hypothetical protein VFC90_14105 [Planctomycetota bacterium]|nr:hypothetical protein [Planctomycetota bacterium]
MAMELLGFIAELVFWIGGALWWDVREEPRSTGRIERGAARSTMKVDACCAYCRKRGGLFVTCRACRAPHHRDCARVNGRCAVYGCRNRKFLVPAA